MSVDDKYSLHNSENLPQLIQMHLSQKQISFSKNFDIFFQKNDTHRLWILETKDCERRR